MTSGRYQHQNIKIGTSNSTNIPYCKELSALCNLEQWDLLKKKLINYFIFAQQIIIKTCMLWSQLTKLINIPGRRR